MARIVITEFMDERAVHRLRAAGHDVMYDPALVDDPPRLAREAASCEALVVRNRTQVRGALLEALSPRCSVVGRLGVGLDNIDVAACRDRGVRVIPATGANAASVAEYVVTTALLLLRGAYASSADVAAGRWPRTALSSGREAGGKTLGLLGFGSIGQATATLARGIGMVVIAHDPMLPPGHAAWRANRTEPVTLDQLFATADAVSLHVPLTDGTRGLVNAERLATMKRGAVLISTARGGIVDEVALVAALKSGQLGGAALDVFDSEPLPVSPHFEGVPNLMLTPHIAGVTAEANERVSFLIADAVIEALA
jgi:(S)-sulfolactate dehydrogenase